MKRICAILLSVLMLVSALSAAPFDTYAATKTYAEDKLVSIQNEKGFIPGKTAVVTGNCYAFASKVCEKLYGVKYDGEGLYGNYRAKHATGNYYTVSTYTTTKTTPTSAVVEEIISFFINNAAPGDVIHYGKYTTDTANTSTHTMIVQCVDNKKIGFYHANYQTTDYAASTCHIDYVYWDSFRKSPTSNVKNSDGTIYSMNSIFYNKMKSAGLGISINRYTKYTDLYYLVGAAVPKVKASGSGSYSIKLTWDEIIDATKYQVDYKKSSATSYTTYTSSCKALTCDILDLEIGTTYTFRVRAYIGKWMSWSDEVKRKVLPAPITKITFTEESDGIKMKWARRTDITGVRIYRAESSDGDYSLIKTVTDNTVGTYLDKNIEYGTEYFYKYERYLVVSGKEYSKMSSVKSTVYELDKPAVTYTNTSTTSADFTLVKNGTSDSFVYYLTDSKGNKLISAETDDSTLTFDSLEPCSGYKFYAAQKTKLGTSEYASVSFTALPAKVTGQKTAAVTNGVKLSWKRISDADGYAVYRSDAKDGKYTLLDSVSGANVLSYTDKSVKYKTAYYYAVAAYDTLGSKYYYGEKSTAVKGKNTVGSITNTKAVRKSPTAITFKWTKAPNATSYSVQYKPDGGKWTTVGTTTGASKTVSKLEIGKTYYFRVRASNDVGTGGYTSPVSLKAGVPKPATPTAKSVSKGIRISYKNESYATGYKIYRATSKNGTYKLVKTVKNNTASGWTDTSAKKGKRYYYKVQCYKKKNGKTYTSAKSNAVSIKR